MRKSRTPALGIGVAPAVFTPAMLPNLALWMDPLQGLDVSSAWVSAEGNAYSFAKSTSAPTLGSIGGIACPSFNGTDQFFNYSGQISTAESGTFIAVCNPVSPTVPKAIYCQSTESVNTYVSMDVATMLRVVVNGDDEGSGDDLLAAAASLYTIESDGTNWRMWVGAASQTVTPAASDGLWFADLGATATFSRIGGGRINVGMGAADGLDFSGPIGDIIITDAPMTAFDRSRVWRYLNAKYNLGLSL